MDDRPAGFVDGHAIIIVRAVASQHEDHLQARERPHECAVRLAETCQALGRDKRKIHAGFQNEAVAFRTVEIITLGMTYEVSDGMGVLAYDDERGVRGEAITQPRQPPAHARAQQQRRRIHRARAQYYDLGVDLVIARLPR